ncbi:hypothetical protein FACS189496_5160 [Bacilli bacterium]|nr:hypothetical protein FACS189496_5160 [Bacilli bacterium]
MKYKPLWIVDIKGITPTLHKKITQTTSKLCELDLLKFIDKNMNHSIARMVGLKGYTDKKEDLIRVKKFISSLIYLDKFEILPFHQLAVSKYKELVVEYKLKGAKSMSKEELGEVEKLVL